MTIWMTARGAGLSALMLLTVSTCIGALASGRGKPATRVVLQYTHRAGASLGLGLLVLHIGMILADTYAHVGVTGAIVPFTSSYRATWVGLGTLAAYCFVFASALGFARGRIAGSERGVAIWRKLHCAAYGGWALAVVHGFKSGTDSSLPWVRVLYVLSVLAVLGAAAFRLSAIGHRAAPLAGNRTAAATARPTTAQASPARPTTAQASPARPTTAQTSPARPTTARPTTPQPTEARQAAVR